jgi:hypothetical protein
MTTPQSGGWTRLMPPASVSFAMTVITVSLGRSLRNQDVVNQRMVTAFVLILLTLGFMNSVDPGFAGAFSLLIFVAVFLTYGPDIMRYVGFNLKSES